MARTRTREDAEFMRAVYAATRRGARPSAHLLLLVIIAFLLVFVLWARGASLDEVTRGQGKVIPSSQVQVLQNLEGGILAEVFVRDGQIVEKEQVLLRIDNSQVAADYRENRAHYIGVLAAVTRLRAEADGTEVEFPPEVMAEAPDVAEDELSLYHSRQSQLDADLDILRRQTEQRRQELVELRGRLEKLQRSLDFIQEELDITSPLVAEGILSRVELLRLQREANEIEGDLEATRLAIPRAEAALREASQRMEERKIKFRMDALGELNQRKAELAMVKEASTAGKDRVFRTDVRSPVRGTVKQILVNTIGGVVRPGEDLVEIVPLEDTLLVEAQIRPADIAFLRPEQEATVKITAYDFSIFGGLKAKVEEISADTIQDDDGESFYRVRLRTERNYLGNAQNSLPIIPGMTASVDILTGEKTVLDYLLNPVLRAKERALRER